MKVRHVGWLQLYDTVYTHGKPMHKVQACCNVELFRFLMLILPSCRNGGSFSASHLALHALWWHPSPFAWTVCTAGGEVGALFAFLVLVVLLLVPVFKSWSHVLIQYCAFASGYAPAHVLCPNKKHKDGVSHHL